MHHPGPPRFVATGEEIELAPRDPDPAGEYTWHLADRPEESNATIGDDPVEHFTPDTQGRYVARLSAPDGEHDQTIRVFPGSLAPAGVGAGASGQSGGRSGVASEGPRRRDRSGPGHSGNAEDEAGSDGGGGRPRVELSAAVEGEAVVVRAEPKPSPCGSERASDLDVAFELDDRDDLTREAVAIGDRDLSAPIDRLTDRLRVYAVAVGEHGYSVPDAIGVAPEREEETNGGTGGPAVDSGPAVGGGPTTDSGPATDGGTAVESASVAMTEGVRVWRPYEPPEWAEDAVIYEIYVRTFGGREATDGDAFDDVVDRLDYISSLGVDTLWLTPVLENDHAPHGYNVTDFFAIAEDLGTREDYRRLIEEARDRDMRVLFDLVCNHSARTHPYFLDAVENPNGEYRDWYAWRTETEPETYFDWEHIANFDFDHLPVRRHLLDVVDEWAPLVDGFRCDMAWAVPNGFWREVHDRVKERDADFLLLDETIPYIPDFQAGLFDEHFDSTTYFALRQVGRGDAPAAEVLDAIDERTEAGFPDYAGFMLYAENHDEPRYLAECGRPAARAALGAVFTLPGSPMVYAGQEFAQLGKRDALAWEHADEKLTDFVRSLGAARNEVTALQADADLVRLDYDVQYGPEDRVVAYGRNPPGGEPVVVVLNFGETAVTVGCDAVRESTDRVSGESVADEGGQVVEDVVVLPAREDCLNG